MRNKTRKVGVLFAAVLSVYIGRADLAGGKTPARTPKDPAPAASVQDPFTNVTPASPAAPPVPVTPVADVAPSTPITTDASTLPSQGTSVSTPVVNVSNAGTVEIHVNEANLIEVLRMLSLQSQKNIIASKDVHGTITANLYDVTVREALDALLATNGYAYREKGNFIYVYTTKEIAEMDRAARVMETRTFELFYTPAGNAATMIKPVLSEKGQVAFTTPAIGGLDSGTTKDSGGATHATQDMLVVTDYPENLTEVKKILKDIDQRPQQILLEATILSATLNETNSLGIDFTLLGNVDFSTLNAAGSSAAAALSGTITSTPTAGTILHNGYAAGGTGFNSNVPSGGLQVGLVRNSIGVFLTALETTTNTTVIANPKILALNKQKGEVIVGRSDGYTTSTTTDTSTVQTVAFQDTGTKLQFRPYIGDDGYIRMEIHPEDSSGGLTTANLPFKVTTETTSNVMVKDGHTIVIGGLFRESTQISRSQVPGLGNLPGIGYLFRSQTDTTVREEIIILLTPHIIKDDAAFSAASEAQMQEANKLRIGTRRGMMPFGRERLAESFYDAAVKEMNNPTGSQSTALWYLDSATNLNPIFGEAIDLKEKLNGQRVTSVDNSTFRSFVRKQIMAEQPAAKQPTSQESLFEPIKMPATKPAMRAEAPATQPANVEATLPSTSPSEVAAISPATQPATAAAVDVDSMPVEPSDNSDTTADLPIDDIAK